jgi:hypothetical protein
VFWTVVAGDVLVWNISAQVRELVPEQAKIELRANFFKRISPSATGPPGMVAMRTGLHPGEPT